MSRLWNIADLIDLHFFCRLDEEVLRKEGEAALAKRDRVIYLAKIEPHLGKGEEVPPRILIRKWLAMRRLHFRQERGRENEVLPGSLWQELSVLGRGLVVLLGLLAGIGAAGSLLLYSGTTPLNVSLFFGLFVLLQLLMILLQSCFLLYRLFRRLPMESTSLYVLVGQAMVRGMEGLRRRLYRRLSGEHRLDLAALVGGIQQRRELAVLLVWPAFMLVQLGGIGFNLGVLGATLSKVVFSDMAFAWQSTLQLSPELLAELVRWIALPWSWVSPLTCPTLAQIQGSQMVLKEGVAHLSSANLAAWWPFLCCSVAVYGLLPRCLLLFIGWIKQRQTLEKLHFATLNFRSLLQRMAAPRVDSNGLAETVTAPLPRQVQRPVSDPVPTAHQSQATPPAGEPLDAQTEPNATALALVLVPEELYGECPLAELSHRLGQRIPGAEITPLPHDESAPIESLDLCRQGVQELSLLYEAWQPPLKETEAFLRKLRATVGGAMPITIFLVGKPSFRTMLTPVDPDQLRIWQMKMQSLGDVNLAVQPLIAP